MIKPSLLRGKIKSILSYTKSKPRSTAALFILLCLPLLVAWASPSLWQSSQGGFYPATQNINFFERKESLPEYWQYFTPIWEVSDFLNPLEVANSTHPTTRRILKDPLDKLSHEFKVPHYLKERVAFWVDIYSRLSSQMKVLHDKRHPGVVYGYFDFRKLKHSVHAHQLEKKKREIEKKIQLDLSKWFIEAMGETESPTLSIAESLKIQAFLMSLGVRKMEDLRELTSHMRTQTGQRDHFIKAIERSKQLLPHIEAQFKQHNLPIELSRIPFVESSFNPKAHSKGGARGIWQFMPDTAEELLPSAFLEDEWHEPFTQTQGAITLLRRYKSVLPDWGTVIVSYNSGVGRVSKTLKKHKLRSIKGLLTHQRVESLGFAGRNFYAEFIAANLVKAYEDELFVLTEKDSMVVEFFEKARQGLKDTCPVHPDQTPVSL